MKVLVGRQAPSLLFLLLLWNPVVTANNNDNNNNHSDKPPERHLLLNIFDTTLSTTTTEGAYVPATWYVASSAAEKTIDPSCHICPAGQQVTRPFFVVELASSYFLTPDNNNNDDQEEEEEEDTLFLTCSYLQEQMNAMPDKFTSCQPSFEMLYADDCQCEPAPSSPPSPTTTTTTTLAPLPSIAPTAATTPTPTAAPAVTEIVAETTDMPTLFTTTAEPTIHVDAATTPTTTMPPTTSAPVADTETETETETETTEIHETCQICPAGQDVTLPMTVIELPAEYHSLTPGNNNNNNGNAFVTCALLESSLESYPEMYVTPCEPSFVELFADACGCATTDDGAGGAVVMEPTSSPVMEIVPEDVVPTSSPVAGTEEEEEETAAATTTPPPLLGWCSLCPFGEEITLPNAIVPVPDDLISPVVSFTTCALLQLAAKTLDSLQDQCLELPSMYAESCGCAPAIAPTTSPVAEIEADEEGSGPTRAPIANTEIECSICESGQVITNPDAVVVLAQGSVVAGREIYITCELLELAAKDNPISIIDLCPDLNAIYAETCGCAVATEVALEEEEKNGDYESDNGSSSSSSRQWRQQKQLCSILPTGAAVALLLPLML